MTVATKSRPAKVAAPPKPARRKDVPRAAPELSVIVPTFRERANIPILVDRLRDTLAGRDWEVIFVDDNSPDGTAQAARELGERDARVRCIRRVGRRGLAGACIEGMLASQAKYVAVMDADLQHDETRLPLMLDKLDDNEADLVVASRYIDGGSTDGLNENRALISRWSTLLARTLLTKELTDPMSGFFMLRREVVETIAPELSSQGFKILLDIMATARGALRVAEVPSEFHQRQHGESKLGANVALEFVGLMLSKLTNDAISMRFLMFCLVGLTGVGIHMVVLTLARAVGIADFGIQQTIATVIAIAWNFVFNNTFTYHDQRLTGWRFVTGLIWFELVCSIGAISNVGVASLIFSEGSNWFSAGLGGAVMGAVWNYAVSAVIVWGAR